MERTRSHNPSKKAGRTNDHDLHAPLLYLCRRCPKCPWGLYASSPPVAMVVVGWFLCFFAVISPHCPHDVHKKKFM